ncbi:thiamine ABC transporter substrate-binding protein [Amycolatopsis aidingensis]|uniref:thiamine ABC transporter substrate-binding protein n=1 Tax=Amycolatopsis aidingensis TaxID=2842453 RepID=UPI001C0C7B3B|nr:thiamine ABC transporter substrate-binding protein [Amycolatopsis aidingensis]
MTRRARTVAALCLAGALSAGCTLAGGGGQQEQGPVTVTLATHDSWNAPQEVLTEFEQRSGIRIKILKEGDAGELTNKLVLAKDDPIADVAYGVDSTFASRALAAGVFEPYTSPEADRGPQRYAIDRQHRLSAVDVGDVCVNIDRQWFAERDLPEPETYADLADPEYRGLLVVQNPATSSPGLAFLLGTIARYGEEGWQDYWSRLRDNGVLTVSGWEEAYTQEFSGSSGEGPRPIVVSYASSPANEIGEDGRPRTKALLETCYRQVEYAGVLAGGDQVDSAGKVVDFLLSQEFQATVAEHMYVYPAREGVPLPAGWAEAAPLPEDPASLPSERVEAEREHWVEQWRALLNQ